MEKIHYAWILFVAYFLDSGESIPEDGEVRLTGGTTPNEGNVQVHHDGLWRNICDDGWDLRDATVVCRQLGYHRSNFATSASRFGLGTRDMWLNNVQCWGYERNLTLCRSDGWGSGANCDTSEAAGVICKTAARATTRPIPTRGHRLDRAFNNVSFTITSNYQRTTTYIPPTTTPIQLLYPVFLAENSESEANEIKANIVTQVRLVGGRSAREGRIEVRLDNKEEWGTICGNSWTLKEADVVCRQLNLGVASRAVQTTIFDAPPRSLLLNGVTCTGKESSLGECAFRHAGSGSHCSGQKESVAGAICAHNLPDLVPDMEFLMSSVYLQEQPMFYLTCAMEENCLSRSAYKLDPKSQTFPWLKRRLLRFTLATKNIGKADFVSFIPKHMWQWHACHKHYHSMEVFAHFDVLDEQGHKVAEGHKASFCLEDNACDEPWQRKYNCANFGDQGISVGCFDIYKHDVDCQWVDLTDAKPGTYTFRVSVNPDAKVAEMSYDNNIVLCKLHFYETTAYFDECTLASQEASVRLVG